MKNMSNEELIADHEDRYIGSGDCTETRAELLRLLDEGERAKEAVEILCYISLDAGIISRGKACEFMGIDRVDLDTKLGEIQLTNYSIKSGRKSIMRWHTISRFDI